MLRIEVDNIAEGQILAQPVIDRFGNVILNAGFVLSPAWRARLRMRQIDYVFIDDTDQAAAGDAPSEEDKFQAALEVAQRIDAMFAEHQNHEVMKYLADAAKRFHVKHTMGGS